MTLTRFHRFPLLRLLLVLAVGGLWVRSHWRSELVGLFVSHGCVQLVGWDRGKVIVALTNVPFGPERAWTLDHLGTTNDEFDDVRALLDPPPPSPAAQKRWGASLGRSPTDPFGLLGAWYRFAVVPFGYPMAVSGLALVVGLRTWWTRRHWGRPGMCGGCGYDLRASAQRCPECGAAVLPRSPSPYGPAHETVRLTATL